MKIKLTIINTWWLVLRGTGNFVSREEVKGNIEIQGEQNSLFPKGPVIKWFVTWQNKTKAKFENRAEIPAITCNSGQHFAGNSELFPVWHHSFRNVARSWILDVNFASYVSRKQAAIPFMQVFHVLCKPQLAQAWDLRWLKCTIYKENMFARYVSRSFCNIWLIFLVKMTFLCMCIHKQDKHVCYYGFIWLESHDRSICLLQQFSNDSCRISQFSGHKIWPHQ